MKISFCKAFTLKILITFCFITFSLTTVQFSTAAVTTKKGNSKLTKEVVSTIINSMITASKKHDVEGIIKNLASDFMVRINLPESLGGGLFVMDLAEYKKTMEESFAMTTEYQYDVSDISITIQNDGESALVTDIVTETININGVILSTKSYETTIIEILDGAPKVVFINGRVKSLP